MKGTIKMNYNGIVQKILPDVASRHLMRDDSLADMPCQYTEGESVIYEGTLSSVLFKIGLIILLFIYFDVSSQVMIDKSKNDVIELINDDKFLDIVKNEICVDSMGRFDNKIVVWYPNGMYVTHYFLNNKCVRTAMFFEADNYYNITDWLNRLYYFDGDKYIDGIYYGEIFSYKDKWILLEWNRGYSK